MSDTAFVLCIEENATKPQALLLIESIRTFTGALRNSQIIAISPRGLGVDRATQSLLGRSHVQYVNAPINTVCPEYGSANRIYAGAWAASRTRASTIFVLDSDTIFLDEPRLLGDDWDVAARPVGAKGSTSTGPEDAFDPYWQSLCRAADFDIDQLPWVETVFDKQRVRASYNGGYLVVRRQSGILERAAEIFTRSVELGLRPLSGHGLDIFSSTGLVGQVASEYWGSNQAALSVAMWSTTRRVLTLEPTYNVQLNILTPETARPMSAGPPVHVHYHWGFDEAHISRSLAILHNLGVSPEKIEWLRQRAPFAR